MTTQPRPLQFNTKTGEPYLPLPAPHSNIIITPPRLTESDEKAYVDYMNNIEVVKWLTGPPFPYLPSHAKEWNEKIYKDTQEILQDVCQKPLGSPINGCPFRILREVQEDGKDILIGNCSLITWPFEEIQGPEEKARAIERNEGLKAGDPLKEWSFGDYIAPSHQGKGIMSSAMNTLIEQWIVPRMQVNIIKASVFTVNTASRRVFERNGFVLWKTIPDCLSIPESKGGGMVGKHILRWIHQDNVVV